MSVWVCSCRGLSSVTAAVVCLPWCCGVTVARCVALLLCVVGLRGWAGFHTGLLWIWCYVIFMVVICVESAGVRHHSVFARCVTVLPAGSWWYLGVCVVLCMIDRLGAAVDIVTKVLISPVSLALIVLSRFPTRKGQRESPAPFKKDPLGASVPTPPVPATRSKSDFCRYL